MKRGFFLKNRLIFIVLFVILGTFLVLQMITKEPTSYPLVWSDYTPFRTTGYLYLLQDIKIKKAVYVSVDEKVTTSMLSNNNQTLTYLQTSDIWNPRACAKMPSLVTKDGSIYMIDSFLEQGVTKKQLIRFDHSNNTTSVAPLSSDIPIHGGLYTTGKSGYFFTQESGNLVKNSFNFVDDTHITKEIILRVPENSYITLYERNKEVYIKISEHAKTKALYLYSTKGQLVEKESLPKQEDIGNLKQKKVLGNGMVTYFDYENVFSVGFVKENNYIPLFMPKLRVVAYIIGGY